MLAASDRPCALDAGAWRLLDSSRSMHCHAHGLLLNWHTHGHALMSCIGLLVRCAVQGAGLIRLRKPEPEPDSRTVRRNYMDMQSAQAIRSHCRDPSEVYMYAVHVSRHQIIECGGWWRGLSHLYRLSAVSVDGAGLACSC